MLVLSRKVGERIVIGDNVEITVLGTRGHQVRLGIEAPAAVSILRGELSWNEAETISLEKSRPPLRWSVQGG